VLSALDQGDVPRIRAALAGSEQGRVLLSKVDLFLERYGFQSENGSDFTTAPWIENPAFVWKAIRRAAALAVDDDAGAVSVKREAARQRVLAHLNPIQGFLFRRLLRSTQTYVDLRQRTSLFMSEDSYQMRRIFLALGEQLVASGKLAQREDGFYLTYEELKRLARGELQAQTAQERIAARRAEMEADASVELPDTICGEYMATSALPSVEGQRYLVGIGSSAGMAQGYARVVDTLDNAPADLGEGDILIVPFTDVSWTPLFVGLGGIVAETGGQLSHTSIIAREYSLPAVVSVRHATHLIQDGQPLTVDGNRGRVYLDHVLEEGGG
jgi:pyruvate,water dikinase